MHAALPHAAHNSPPFACTCTLHCPHLLPPLFASLPSCTPFHSFAAPPPILPCPACTPLCVHGGTSDVPAHHSWCMSMGWCWAEQIIVLLFLCCCKTSNLIFLKKVHQMVQNFWMANSSTYFFWLGDCTAMHTPNRPKCEKTCTIPHLTDDVWLMSYLPKCHSSYYVEWSVHVTWNCYLLWLMIADCYLWLVISIISQGLQMSKS